MRLGQSRAKAGVGASTLPRYASSLASRFMKDHGIDVGGGGGRSHLAPEPARGGVDNRGTWPVMRVLAELGLGVPGAMFLGSLHRRWADNDGTNCGFLMGIDAHRAPLQAFHSPKNAGKLVGSATLACRAAWRAGDGKSDPSFSTH